MKKLQELLLKNGYDVTVDGIVGPKTLAAAQSFISKELSKRNWIPSRKGFVFLRLDNTLTDTFDDIVLRVNNYQVDSVAPCSTTAGKFWIFNPVTVGGVTGTAITQEQQVIGSHQFTTSANWKTLWLGAPYFQQVKPVKIYRDGTKDWVNDKTIIQEGLFGINFHRAGIGNIIDRWSAGCQVVQDTYWYKLIEIFTQGEYIDYTLIVV